MYYPIDILAISNYSITMNLTFYRVVLNNHYFIMCGHKKLFESVTLQEQ